MRNTARVLSLELTEGFCGMFSTIIAAGTDLNLDVCVAVVQREGGFTLFICLPPSPQVCVFFFLCTCILMGCPAGAMLLCSQQAVYILASVTCSDI